ncbi:hypothetical protein Vafri_3237 [Volvox africanus]|uniref:Uncharacterized protein n=1 Tax=Volvox africanus TaxID=51714 RepID=A0A8J4ARV2_9CHLO|nr:hypothetical protein Vafri_3237 [Volvox africanus]
MAPLRVRSTRPIGPRKRRSLAYKAKVELPWCQRGITSAWRLQSMLEGEVGTLKTVIEALQASSAEALAAADQRTEALQQQVEALQQQVQLAEANVQVIKAEHEQQVSTLTTRLATAEQVAEQERSQWRVNEEIIMTDAQARVCTAEAKAAIAQSKLKTELLTTEKLRRKVQAAMEAAIMDAVKSAQLGMDLQAAKSEIQMLHKENREWKAKEVDMRSMISCADTRKEALEVELKALQNALAERNEQEGHQLRAEVENKDFEIGRLKEEMARQDKIMQDTARQVEAMEKDKCTMKDNLTEKIHRLEHLVSCTEKRAAYATADYHGAMKIVARLKLQLTQDNLTEEIHRLEHLVSCTEKRAADATADYDGAMRMVARLKLQLAQVWEGKAEAWALRAEALGEKEELKAQLVEAKVTIARERSLARVDRREEIRCLKVELRRTNEAWSRRCEELEDALWRRELQAARRTDMAACSGATSGK